MTCECCTASKETPDHLWYDPACIWCGARLIQRIKARPGAREELTRRMRAVLADWVALGHSEAEIRRLVAGPVPLQPTGPVEKSESAPPSPTKPRSASRKR